MSQVGRMEMTVRVEFTNLEKVLYPASGVTKGQVIKYYIKVAPRILDFLRDRPTVMTRYPEGVEKEGFYEKDAPRGTPSWVKTFKRYSDTAEREVNFIVCNDLDTLLWLANLAALELHITLSKIERFESPDLVLLDVDPEPPIGFDDAVEVALLAKEGIASLGLECYVKTSGKKGLHIIIPVNEGYSFQETREFVHQIGRYLAKESNIVVSEFGHSRDPGTVFIDYLQNSHGRTMVCPYSLRATASATVSTPLDWKDVRKGLRPDQLNMISVLKEQKNPWAGLLSNRQKLEVSSFG
jgi:bifunctional non-homologous end joining protein LigD